MALRMMSVNPASLTRAKDFRSPSEILVKRARCAGWLA